MMRTFKVWFELNNARFAMEFKGDWNDVSNAAHNFAARMGATFNYEMEELQ